MAEINYNSEKIQEERVETKPSEEVSSPSNLNKALPPAPEDSTPETVSVSTFMAIFVSPRCFSIY